MQKLTASLEDYLEIICNYDNCKKKIRAIDISKELKVSRASVTEALKKLASKNFITYGRYDNIALTEEGRKIAQDVVSKHNVLQIFFESLGLTTEEASENACKVEHVITQNAFDKISQYIKKQD